MFSAAPTLMPQVKNGIVRGLAVTSAKRSPFAPDIPTIAESGVPGFATQSWYGLFVRANTAANVVQKINADVGAVLAQPAVKQRFDDLGSPVTTSTPMELGAQLKAEMQQWGPIIKAANIKGE
jgi:tripartite-type tricarboxylate transporter receptor subunit TctC